MVKYFPRYLITMAKHAVKIEPIKSEKVHAYSAGEEKSPLFIFLHDQLPFFLGETGRNSGKFLQVSPGNPLFSPGNTCISP